MAGDKKKSKSSTARFSEILGTLVRYGMADWVKDPYPDYIKDRFRTAGGVDVRELSQGVRIRLALTELGPTFIKVGQIASTRIDLVGPEVAEELEKLQSDTPPDPPETVLETIESELGRPASEVFEAFNATAFASASIGQAHHATLPGGQEVVVKVQHAGIMPTIVADLDILATLARVAEQYDAELRFFQPEATVAELRRSLLQELDYGAERRFLQRIGENFASDPHIRVPTVFPELSSNRVLTMEKLDGYSIGDSQRMAEDGVDGAALLHRAANAFMDMIFRDRLYHADPHPGNLWVLAPGDVLGILDFGKVAELDRSTQDKIQDLILGLLSNDPEFLTDSVIRLGSVPEGLDRHALQRDIESFISGFLDNLGGSADAGVWLDQLMVIIRTHHIVLPTGVTLLLRLMIMLEGTVRRLDPEFNVMVLLQARSAQFTQEHILTQEKLAQMVMRSYRDWDTLARVLPGALAAVASRARDGRIQTQVDMPRLNCLVNRTVQCGLSAALLITSTLLLGLEIPPFVRGVSALGAVALLSGSALAWQVFRAIGKSGGLYEDRYK